MHTVSLSVRRKIFQFLFVFKEAVSIFWSVASQTFISCRDLWSQYKIGSLVNKKELIPRWRQFFRTVNPNISKKVVANFMLMIEKFNRQTISSFIQNFSSALNCNRCFVQKVNRNTKREQKQIEAKDSLW